MATGYEIDYNDKRFTEVTSQKNAAIKESDKTYDNMINSSDKYFQQQTDAIKQYGDKQTQVQQQQTDFAIEKVEQQKEQAHKDYLKEQSGAYVDWQKQSNDYGTNAEKQASAGLAHSGYSESSQVSMYNTYQNRVMTARESYNRAVLNYDNAIKDAQLQNSSVLAEIAYNTLQKSLELSLQGFQYKNNLVLDKAKAKRELENTYYQRYQNVLSQINTENALAEQIRQFNEQLAEEKRQFNESLNASSGSSGSGGGSYYSSGGSYDYYDDEGGEYYLEEQSKLDAMSQEQRNRLYQGIGMNRSTEGRVNAINNLYKQGTISEGDAETLLERYTS